MCDLPLLPGELHAAFVLTTQGNATIATVDTSTALVSTDITLQQDPVNLTLRPHNNCPDKNRDHKAVNTDPY